MKSDLYPNYQNPLLEKPERTLPREIAILGAGTIGPDIGYYLKSALPDVRLFLVDVVESYACPAYNFQLCSSLNHLPGHLSP